MNILAIDPGQNGATCYLPEKGDIKFLDHKNSDSRALYSFMDDCAANLIIIEDVHSLYGMSAKSNFKFGYNLGVVTTISELMAIDLYKVQPKIWQKYIGCTKPTGKELKKEIAHIADLLYPSANIRGKRGGLLDGRSDALMIGHYAFHNHKELT